MKASIFSTKLQQYHQVSNCNNPSNFLCSYIQFENLALFGPDPLTVTNNDVGGGHMTERHLHSALGKIKGARKFRQFYSELKKG
jgi:hypothetical protein